MTRHPPADDFDPVERFEGKHTRILVRDEAGDWDAYQTAAGAVYRTRLRPGTEKPAFLSELATRHNTVNQVAQEATTREALIDQLATQAEAGTPLSAADLRRLLAALARRRR